MASTRKQAEIAARCRRIGWPVKSGDGNTEWLYKITRPTGRHVYLHSSPSDINWPKIALQQLNGREKAFDKAEADWKDQHERERQEKLADDQAAGDRKLTGAAKAAKQRAAVERAAGPHAVTEFDPGWLLTPHELPDIRRGILTPALASKLLATVDRSRENRHQRSYRLHREREFADMIEAGDFRFTHQGFAVDTAGRLQDGQHRAGAIVTTGQPQEIVIFVGMPPENFVALDIPLTRTVRDAADIRGETDVSKLTAAARSIMMFDRLGGDYGNYRRKLSVTAVDRFIEHEGGDPLRYAVRRCIDIRKDIKIVASALTAAVYLIGRAAGDDNPQVIRFFDDLATGIGIEHNGSMYRLRRIFNDPGGHVDQYTALALIIKVWNAQVVGRKLGHLAWRKDEAFPATIIVPAPED
jgi:hypothetical protein